MHTNKSVKSVQSIILQTRVVLVCLLCLLGAPAGGQASHPRTERRVGQVLREGTKLQGTLLRSVCSDDPPGSDTVSVAISHAPMSSWRGRPIPRHFLMVIRRTTVVKSADAGDYIIDFTAVRGSLGKAKFDAPLAEFRTDIEELHREERNRSAACFSAGGGLKGRLTRTLHLP